LAGISSRLSPLKPSSGSAVYSSRKLKNADTASLFGRKTSLDVFKENVMALDEATFNSHTKTYFQVQLDDLDRQIGTVKKKIFELENRQQSHQDRQDLQKAPFVVRAFTFDSLDRGVTSLLYKDQLADSLKSSLKQLQALEKKKSYFSQFTSFFDKSDMDSGQLQETLTTQKQSLESDIVRLEASVARLERSVKDEKAISHLTYVNPGVLDVSLNNLGTNLLNAFSGTKVPLQLSAEDDLKHTRIALRIKQESLQKMNTQIDALKASSSGDFVSKKNHVFLEMEKQYNSFSKDPSKDPALKWAFEKLSDELKRRPNLASFPEVVYTDPLSKAQLKGIDTVVSLADVQGSLVDEHAERFSDFTSRQDNQGIKILGFLPSLSSSGPDGPQFSHLVYMDLKEGSIVSESLLLGDAFLYRQDISSDFEFLTSFIAKTASINPDDSWFSYLIKNFQIASVGQSGQGLQDSYQKLNQLWLPHKENALFSQFKRYFSKESLS